MLTRHKCIIIGPAHEILAHIIFSSNEGSGKLAQMHSLDIALTARIQKVWMLINTQIIIKPIFPLDTPA